MITEDSSFVMAEPAIVLDRTITHPIGVGSFGTVYKAKWGDKTVAVKIINLHQIRHSPKFEKYRKVETNELVPFTKALRHPNIVAILACETTHFPEVWFALELCDCGLDEYVKEQDLSDMKTKIILEQAATGIAFLHANNVVHRDVKPNNFLVVLQDSGVQIKVTDYSLCKDVDSLPGSTMTTVHGNKHWMAPELLTKDEHSATEVTYKRSVDVFSMALVIMYVCINSAGRKLLETIISGSVVKAGEDLLKRFEKHWRRDSLRIAFYPLLKKMLKLDPGERPSMEKVVKSIRLSQTPEVVTTCPSLKYIRSCSLNFHGNPNVGIGGDNFLLVGDEDTNMLHLIQLRQQQDNKGLYHRVWSKQQPSKRVYNRKYIRNQTIITGAASHSSCHDLNFQRFHVHRGREYAELINAFQPHNIVYIEKIQIRQYKLSIKTDTHEMVLQPPRGTHWNSYPSMICRHSTTGWMAVSDSYSLGIYNRTGKLRHHVKLKFCADSIDCTESHIFMSEYGVNSAILHVVAWSGVEVGTFNLNPLLKCCRVGNSVSSIRICQNNVLHIVVGDLKTFPKYVTSLHAFRIE